MSANKAPDHFCDARLLPGECLHCVGKPRPFVNIVSWAHGSSRVEVEILGRTPRRVRIRFLADNMKGQRGDVRLVAPGVVQYPTGSTR